MDCGTIHFLPHLTSSFQFYSSKKSVINKEQYFTFLTVFEMYPRKGEVLFCMATPRCSKTIQIEVLTSSPEVGTNSLKLGTIQMIKDMVGLLFSSLSMMSCPLSHTPINIKTRKND